MKMTQLDMENKTNQTIGCIFVKQDKHTTHNNFITRGWTPSIFEVKRFKSIYGGQIFNMEMSLWISDECIF